MFNRHVDFEEYSCKISDTELIISFLLTKYQRKKFCEQNRSPITFSFSLFYTYGILTKLISTLKNGFEQIKFETSDLLVLLEYLSQTVKIFNVTQRI